MTSLQSAPEPVVGVFALRTFRVSANGYLLPLSFTGADWADGTCIARCGRGHAAPADGCTCGIYSLRDLRDLRLQYWSARRLVAVVALEGQTVEGSKGWRSQAARVVDVWTGTGRRKLPAEQLDLLRSHLPGVRFHTDMGGMLAGYPELVPVRRPRSALFARAARSWWSSVTSPPLPGARRFAVWAAEAVLLTAVLCTLSAGSAVVAGQLAAALLVLAVVVMLCESPTQLVTVLIAGASPPLLLTPHRPVLRLFRPATVLLTAGAAASVLTGQPFPVTDVAVSAAVGRGADRGAVHVGFGAVDLTGPHRGLRAGRASRRRPPPGVGTGAAHYEWAAARPPRHRPGADHSPTTPVPYCWSVTHG